jgi:hypothetical protein
VEGLRQIIRQRIMALEFFSPLSVRETVRTCPSA